MGERVTKGKGIRVALAWLLTAVLAHGQSSLLVEPQRSSSKPAAVQYLYPEQITIPANKPTRITLHFRIASGLHINSHTPSDRVLIPTTLTIPEDSGVRLEEAVYPQGTEFSLPLDPATKLSVYTGEFTVRARITAAPGEHLVEAKLRYQACDNNACMPPRTIPVALEVIAR
jgi:DsbC/DsbD-like thiol-disulfide interchange protein